MVIYAGTHGYSDKVPLDNMSAWESALLRYLETSHPQIGKDIAMEKQITEENESALVSALDSFSSTWQ